MRIKCYYNYVSVVFLNIYVVFKNFVKIFNNIILYINNGQGWSGQAFEILRFLRSGQVQDAQNNFWTTLSNITVFLTKYSLSFL